VLQPDGLHLGPWSRLTRFRFKRPVHDAGLWR